MLPFAFSASLVEQSRFKQNPPSPHFWVTSQSSFVQHLPYPNHKKRKLVYSSIANTNILFCYDCSYWSLPILSHEGIDDPDWLLQSHPYLDLMHCTVSVLMQMLLTPRTWNPPSQLTFALAPCSEPSRNSILPWNTLRSSHLFKQWFLQTIWFPGHLQQLYIKTRYVLFCCISQNNILDRNQYKINALLINLGIANNRSDNVSKSDTEESAFRLQESTHVWSCIAPLQSCHRCRICILHYKLLSISIWIRYRETYHLR